MKTCGRWRDKAKTTAGINARPPFVLTPAGQLSICEVLQDRAGKQLRSKWHNGCVRPRVVVSGNAHWLRKGGSQLPERRAAGEEATTTERPMQAGDVVSRGGQAVVLH